MDIHDFRASFHQNVMAHLQLPKDKIDLFLAGAWSSQHILLEGPPGTGKTTLAKVLGQLIGDWSRIQMTSDSTPSDLLGHEVLVSSHPLKMEFRRGPIFHRLVMIDEINRAMPRTQSSLLQAMEERGVEIDGVHHALDPHFCVVATQNPFDHDGTYLLPMSQLDRFGLCLPFEIPQDEELESIMRFSYQRRPPSETTTLGQLPPHQHLDVHDDWLRVISGLQNFLGRTHSKENWDGAQPQSVRSWKAWLELGSCLSQIQGKDHLSTSALRELLPHVFRHRLQGSLDLPSLLQHYDKLTGHR